MPDSLSDRSALLTEDRHQQALYRLAAVAQYLYDTMNGSPRSDRTADDPLPALSMERVREAQDAIDAAIKNGQRTRRTCLAGQLELIEREPPPRPKARRLIHNRWFWITWLPQATSLTSWGFHRHPVGGFYLALANGALYFRKAT